MLVYCRNVAIIVMPELPELVKRLPRMRRKRKPLDLGAFCDEIQHECLNRRIFPQHFSDF